MVKKKMILLILVLVSVLFGKYNVGEICDDISWTDNEGFSTSIHERTSEGKAVFIFITNH